MLVSRRRVIGLFSALAASLSVPSRARANIARFDDLPEGVVTALERINAYRVAAGVPPAELHPALMASAAGHVSYFDQNMDAGIAGLGLHQQSEERPGFTGATMRDRARGAGYSSGPVTENAGFANLVIAVDWAMSTVNHRLPLIHPSAVDLGLAESDSSGFNVMAVGLRREVAGVNVPSFYPADGMTRVPRQWDGGETPDSAPGVPRPLGFPISVCFGLGSKVGWETLELIGPDDQPVEVDMREISWMSAAALIPHRPFERGARYLVRLIAQLDAGTLSAEAVFRTL
jgi:hypothetical protein